MRIFFLIVCALGTGYFSLSTLSQIDEYSETQDQQAESRSDKFQERLEAASKQLASLLERVQFDADQVASALSEGTMPKPELLALLRNMLGKSDAYYGGAIAFAPYAYDPNLQLFSPYVFKSNGELKTMQIEQGYDYSDGSQEWFSAAMAEGSRWSSPYFDESVGDILMVTYSSVFLNPETGERMGVVTIDLSIDAVGLFLNDLDFGDNGFSELFTTQGQYVFSPSKYLVLEQQSIYSDDALSENETFLNLFFLGENGTLELDSNGVAMLIGISTIQYTGWRLISRTNIEIPRTTRSKLKQLFHQSILTGIAALALFTLFLQILFGQKINKYSWLFYISVSVIFFIGIVFIWRMANLFGGMPDSDDLRVASYAAQKNIQETYRSFAKDKLLEPPEFVKAGVFIESIKLISNNDISISGKIWQKIDGVTVLDSIKEATPALKIVGASNYRYFNPSQFEENNSVVGSWDFQAQVRFRFDTTHYPIVKDIFSLVFVPSDHAANTVLIPDLESYNSLIPTHLPGISDDTFINGWDITSSYFTMRERHPKTTFGQPRDSLSMDYPQMAFNMVMSKSHIDVFISNLTPLIIAATMVFLTLLVSSNDPVKLEFIKTGMGFELRTSVTLFFVIVLSHIGVRNNVQSDTIFYLEYFYFLMYTNLLILAVHSILHALKPVVLEKGLRGLKPAQLFLPFNFGLTFLFSWWVFKGPI